MPASLEDLLSAVQATAIATFVRDDIWAYPALETVHLVGLGLVFGCIVAFDLRVLGLTRSLPLDLMARHLLPWVWIGFTLNVVSGTLLVMSDAVEFAANPALQWKLLLIAAAGANAALFQIHFGRNPDQWKTDGRAPFSARVSAGVSIGLWVAIVAAGRLMAYVK